MKTCQICGKPITDTTRPKKYCKPCAHEVNRKQVLALKRRQRLQKMKNGTIDARGALMHSTKHWEYDGRRLPFSAVKAMVACCYVDELTVTWQKRTYQAQNGKLIEVKNG
jgi:hypothetical protein